MRLVIALGGNALLKRGEPMLCENQRENVSLACRQIAKAYAGNELVVTHGNGPQVGLLALQNNAYKKVPMYHLDVIGAESVGMIGYMIQQELVNYVPKTATLATIQADPKSLREFGFAKGSMGPKVEAACRFVERTGKTAVIGALSEIEKILAGESGTRVVKEEAVVYG